MKLISYAYSFVDSEKEIFPHLQLSPVCFLPINIDKLPNLVCS